MAEREGGLGGQPRETNLLGQSMVPRAQEMGSAGWWWDCGEEDGKLPRRLPSDTSAPEQPCGFCTGQ